MKNESHFFSIYKKIKMREFAKEFCWVPKNCDDSAVWQEGEGEGGWDGG